MPLPISATALRNRLLSRARLRHLHIFVKVAELQSLKRAADAIGIAQPSATQALADLERLLECALFLRHSQGMALTTAGALLLPMASRMIGLVDETATRAAEISQGAVGVLRVAAISAAMGGELGRVLPLFARRHPQQVLEVIEADAQQQAGLLAQHEIDCAICRQPAVMPAGWTFTPLWPDRFAILASPQHPLAARRRVGMKDLLAYMWLVPPVSISARGVFDQVFAEQITTMRQYSLVSASPALVWSLLAEEQLLTLLPVSLMQRFLQTGQLVQIRWPQALPFEPIGLMTPDGERSLTLDRFVQFLREKQQIRAV